MNPDDLKNFKPLLIKTAGENLVNVDKYLETLRQNNNDQEAIKNLHIIYHSLKGEFFMVELMNTGALCLKLELVFKKFLDSPNSLNSQDLISITKQSEALKTALDNFENDLAEADLTENTKEIDMILTRN